MAKHKITITLIKTQRYTVVTHTEAKTEAGLAGAESKAKVKAIQSCLKGQLTPNTDGPMNVRVLHVDYE